MQSGRQPVDLVTYWTIRDTDGADCLELGPVERRDEAEAEARRLRFPYLVFHRDYRDPSGRLVRAEQVIFRLPDVPVTSLPPRVYCPVCGIECNASTVRERENWRDFHEFENSGHTTIELRWTGTDWRRVPRSGCIQ